jgi:hypothetical protein
VAGEALLPPDDLVDLCEQKNEAGKDEPQSGQGLAVRTVGIYGDDDQQSPFLRIVLAHMESASLQGSMTGWQNGFAMERGVGGL